MSRDNLIEKKYVDYRTKQKIIENRHKELVISMYSQG